MKIMCYLCTQILFNDVSAHMMRIIFNPNDTMKRFFQFFVACSVALAIQAQVPQFSYQNFENWIYTNPSIELNADNILNNKIVLYTTSTGLQQTLTSPQFSCVGGQAIDMHVRWITDQWKSQGFVVSKVALTAALINEQGVVVDSVTYTPTEVSRTNNWDLSITVPKGVRKARLRFASWKADVNSNGAVNTIVMTSSLKGDVNLDGEVNVADINAVINLILGGNSADDVRKRADVNGDSEINVSDINSVIDVMIN